MNNEFHVHYNPAYLRWEMYVTQRGLVNGQLAETATVGQPVIFLEPDVASASPATLDFSHEEMQQLMDAMWKAGVRPTNQTQQDTEHMKLHLEDMRRLVFQRFDNPDPRPNISEILTRDMR